MHTDLGCRPGGKGEQEKVDSGSKEQGLTPQDLPNNLTFSFSLDNLQIKKKKKGV